MVNSMEDILQWFGIAAATAGGVFAVGKKDQKVIDMAEHLRRVERMAERNTDRIQTQGVDIAEVKTTASLTLDLVKQIHEQLGRHQQ